MKKSILFLFIINILLSFGASVGASDDPEVIITAEVQKELFPVISKFVSESNSYTDLPAIVKWHLTNQTNGPVTISITSEISDWAPPSISTITLEANENKEFRQTPFGIKLLRKHSSIPATIMLKASINDKIIYQETKSLNIRSADEMVWSLNKPYDTSPLIAAWVTPNNDYVETILSRAKERLYSRSLSGYQEQDITSQVNAIFYAVRNSKISYVNSMLSFGRVGFTQRVRLPEESIVDGSANCIDGAVLFASLFENIGLEPVIVLIPHHAFVGVHTSKNSSETLFIETTIVGRRTLNSIFTLESTFNAAVREGAAEYNKALQSDPSSVHVIDIKKARESGIYPLW